MFLLTLVAIALAENGYLGARINSVDQGAWILLVEKDSAASKIGLNEGDIITHANGFSLSGLSTQEQVNKIKGEAFQELTLVVDKYPHISPPVELVAVRTPRDPPKKLIVKLEPEWREVNVLVSAARSGRMPDLVKTVEIWKTADNPKPLLQALKQLDAFSLTSYSFEIWDYLSKSEVFIDYLKSLDPDTKAEAAEILIRYLPFKEIDLVNQKRITQLSTTSFDELLKLELTKPMVWKNDWVLNSPFYSSDLAAYALDRTNVLLNNRLWRAGFPIPNIKQDTPLVAEAPPIKVKPFSVTSLDNQVLTMDNSSAIITFWSTTCGPCRSELTALNNVQFDIPIWAFTDDPNKEDIVNIVNKLNLQFPVAQIPNSLSNQFSVTSVPKLVVIKDGVIISEHMGFSEDLVIKIKDELASTKPPSRNIGYLLDGSLPKLVTENSDTKMPSLAFNDSLGNIWVCFDKFLYKVNEDLNFVDPITLPTKPNLGLWFGENLVIAIEDVIIGLDKQLKPIYRSQNGTVLDIKQTGQDLTILTSTQIPTNDKYAIEKCSIETLKPDFSSLIKELPFCPSSLIEGNNLSFIYDNAVCSYKNDILECSNANRAFPPYFTTSEVSNIFPIDNETIVIKRGTIIEAYKQDRLIFRFKSPKQTLTLLGQINNQPILLVYGPWYGWSALSF